VWGGGGVGGVGWLWGACGGVRGDGGLVKRNPKEGVCEELKREGLEKDFKSKK